jgi:hypothetical protein
MTVASIIMTEKCIIMTVGAVSARLAAIVQPGNGGSHGGATVDLDALLWLLVCEFNAGNAPRSPLLFPRRVTDGTLFNVFNSQSPIDAQSFLVAANAKVRCSGY